MFLINAESVLHACKLRGKEQNGKLSSVEYLDVMIENEPECFKIQFASPQAGKFNFLFFSIIINH